MPSVLIVDDLLSIHEMLDAVIQPTGFSTAFATDGEKALARYKAEKFDLVLADIDMKPMDGITLLKNIKAYDPNCVLIIMTAYASTESAIQALKFGAFDYLQRDGHARSAQSDHDIDPDERTWLRDETGGSVYLRLTTRPLEQPTRRSDDAFRQGVIDGAYWLRKPGPNAEVVLVYQGCVAPEVIEAAGRLGEGRRDIGVLAVTSADRLNAGWTAAQRARRRGVANARGHAEALLEGLPSHCTLVTVIDGHPATLAWMGGVAGHRTVPLGVEHFGQTGTVADLYRHFGIDAEGIVKTVSGLTAGRKVFV